MATNIELEQKINDIQQSLSEKDAEISRLRKLVEPKAVNDEKVEKEKRNFKVVVSTYKTDKNSPPRLVKSWKMIQDEVEVIGSSVVETQIVRIILDDGSPLEMSYRDFVRLVNGIQVPVIMEESEIVERETEKGEKRYDLRSATFVFPYDNKKYTLPNIFLNNP